MALIGVKPCQYRADSVSYWYMTTPTRADTLERLTEVAGYQEGFFSAAQASAAGVDRYRLRRLADAGLVERDEKGIYRFTTHVPTDRAELWRAVIWPTVGRNPKDGPLPIGVLSHGSALEIYNVSTINPSKIDITVPKSFRVRRDVPSIYRLHYADFERSDLDQRDGLPVTSFYRTLIDLIVDGLDTQFVDEALANTATLLTPSQRDTLKALRSLDRRALDVVLRKLNTSRT